MITKQTMNFLFTLSFLIMIPGMLLIFLGFTLVKDGKNLQGLLCFVPFIAGLICYIIADKDKVEIYQREKQKEIKSQSCDQ